jgi:glycosyltransferase involved in cell wall biosynthesis
MRIGIDVGFLLTKYSRSGIYIYLRQMLEGIYRIAPSEDISLFIPGFSKDCDPRTRNEIRRFFRGWSIRNWSFPKWAYNLRMRFSAHSCMQVFHFPFASSLSSFTEYAPSRANVFTIPDLTFIRYPNYHLPGNVEVWSQFCERAVKFADMILVYSEHTRQDVVRTLGIPEHKIQVTPLAAGSEFRLIADRSLVQRQLATFCLQNQRYILSVGTLEPRKNQSLLIRAFSRMLKLDPDLPHQLVLAGSKGWLYDSIFETVKQERLEDRVIFLGHCDPLEVLYNGADLMVYPSLYEGFGLPPLEAMACGTPVIASNSSSLPEVVGDAALTVDPEDEEALCEAMRGVLLDDELRKKMGCNGVRHAQQFSWERTAKATLDAYHEAYRMKF